MASINISLYCTYMSDCSPTCPFGNRITKLETQYDLLTPLVSKIDLKLDQVILGLSRVEILELKHDNHSESLNRAFSRIEATEKQIAATTQAVQDMISQVKGMARVALVVWTLFGATVGFILNKVI